MDHKLDYLSKMVFNKNTWKSVLGSHNMRIPEFCSDPLRSEIQHSREFRLTSSYLEEWNLLFGGGSADAIVPYSYYWPWMMEFLMHHLLPSLGLNLRHVLHLRQEAEFVGQYRNGDGVYRNHQRLIDLCPLEKNRVMLVTETIVTNQTECMVFRARDFTIVLDVPQTSLEALCSSKSWNRTSLGFMKNGFRRKKPIFERARDAPGRCTFYCDDDFWLRFGLVSGAVSLTHGYWLISRYFRKQDPFLQGMCTGNLVLYLLMLELGERLKGFEVSFSDKLYFPQQVELRFDDQEFELFDEKNRQVAFGRRKKVL